MPKILSIDGSGDNSGMCEEVERKTLVYYVLMDLDNHRDLDENGGFSSDGFKYKTLSEASAGKNRIGNCYIDKRRSYEIS